MAGFCIPKEKASDLRAAFNNGIITPDSLVNMTSKSRRALLEEYVGPEKARQINAELESKFLLKNYKAGITREIGRLTDVPKEVRKDMVAKVESIEKWMDPFERDLFLEDLASRRLGFEVTYDQMKQLTESINKIKPLEEKVKNQVGEKAQEEYLANETIEQLNNRLELGYEKEYFREYLGELNHGKATIKEQLTDPLAIAGTAKALKASIDISFPGRQGWSVLMSNPKIWMKGTKAGLKSLVNELGGVDNATRAVRAEIISRPNALNGKYEATKTALGLSHEEIFPSSLPERIPVLGRAYKASEAAYTSSALRMRADLADVYIKIFEENGMNILQNPKQARAVGELAGSMSGRGKLPFKIGEGAADVANVTFFSPRNLMANVDILTGHMAGFRFEKGPGRTIGRKIAAKNTLKTITGTAVVLMIARELLGEDAVNFDPRATDFGRIRVGNMAYDVSGGMASIPRLAARLVTQSYIDSRGRMRPLGSDYGQLSGMDMIWQFTEGKFSPLAAIIRDIINQSHFMGEPVTGGSLLKQATFPIIAEQAIELLDGDEDSDIVLLALILEAMGIGNVYYK